MIPNCDSTTIVIFGATGDLTHRKLIPALYNNFHKERLTEFSDQEPYWGLLLASDESGKSIQGWASAERMRVPFSAPLPVPTMIDSGVARPRAQGQAMISTATAATRA